MKRIALFPVQFKNPSFFVRAEPPARTRAWPRLYDSIRRSVPK